MADERDNADALRRALGALRELRARLAQAEQAAHEPIAIVGIGCRFPGGSDTPEGYWDMLRDGRDAVRDVPADRWNLDDYYDPNPEVAGRMYARTGGFLDQSLQHFDAGFFGISPREAESLDPQQRLLLETSWEALEHAGIAPMSLSGTDAGVYLGIGTADYGNLRQRYPNDQGVDLYSGTGSAYCVASGRLSFFLGLHGPNIAVDTACSSSLVSVLLAVQSLRSRSCSLALAGGVNAMISPFTTIYMCNLGALSAAGRCATFDGSADGYVRGEGCGILVLKRLADAERDGDQVHAILRGGAYNHDGRSAGLTVPNGTAQRAVLTSALADAGLTPSDVQYVEAHGTGTPLGDPIELHALGAVYGHGRNGKLAVGSVKTNMGHLEAAAGVAGLIKCALALKHGSIPKHLHFRQPSPHVDWATLPVEVVTDARPWSAETRQIAGVSAFGISGTNAHVLVEASPAVHDDRADADFLSVQVLPLAAYDAASLAAVAAKHADHLERVAPRLADVALTLGVGRTQFRERAVLVASDTADAVRQLRLVAAGALDQIAASGRTANDAPKVAFIFTGQGAQYAGMGATLDATYPVFRAAIDRCAAVVDGRLEVSLRELLFGSNAASTAIDQTANTQPALFALEFALAELLGSWGVRPRFVMGHSVGEYVAAVVAGSLALETALALVCERGRLMQSLPDGGAMGAVALPEAAVRELMSGFPSLDLAAVNAPASCVVSGAESDVLALIAVAKASGAHATRLAVSHAFHSRLMAPMLDEFERAASGLAASDPSIPVISNRTGDVIGAREMGSPAYWRDHLRGTVRFADGVATLGRLGADIIIEVGPTPTLLGQARESLTDVAVTWAGTLRRGREELRAVAETVATVHAAGVVIDWRAFHAVQPARRIALPTYAWQRQRFWKDFMAQDGRARTAAPRVRHPLLTGRIDGPMLTVESQVGVNAPAYLTDHRIFNLPLFPATGYLELALAAAREQHGDTAVSLRDVAFRDALRLPDDGRVTLRTLLMPERDGAQEFQVFSWNDAPSGDAQAPWRLHASGQVVRSRSATPAPLSLDAIRARCSAAQPDVTAYYAALAAFGGDYGPAFQAIVEINQGQREALGLVCLPAALCAEGSSYRLHPVLLDACFQLSAAAIGIEGDPTDVNGDAYVPIGASGLRVYQHGVDAVWAHVTVPTDTIAGQATVTASLTLVDADGRAVADIESLTVRRVSRAALLAIFEQRPKDDGLYQLEWVAQSTGSLEPPAPGHWLVLTDASGTSAALAAELRTRGHEASLVDVGAREGVEPAPWHLGPTAHDDAQRLLEAVSAEVGESMLRGVVVMWPYDTPLTEPSLAAMQAVQETVLRSTLALSQALDGTRVPLWIVTRGSQAFAGATPDVLQAPVWGLGGVIATENPVLRCVRIDLDPRADRSDVHALVDELFVTGDEQSIAFRDGNRLVARLLPARLSPPRGDAACRLDIPVRGQLENLSLTTIARQAPAQDEVEIEVRASGLNFRDVLNALGAYPGDAGALGNECSGVVTAVGANVTDLRIGDEVIALPQGAIATHVLAPARLTVRKPSALSFAQAATIPVTFLTAHFALLRLGRMEQGDRVLIHAGTGGVGMAAIQLARRAGATIIATAGSPSKRDHLMHLGASIVADSRSPDFDQQVREALGGDGVDIVLNSLAGDFIPNSLGLLRDGGRFIELGKTGVWDANSVAAAYPGVAYHVFFLGELALTQPELVREILQEIVADFASGELTPLPMHVFPLSRAEDAFRFMAQAKHSGKIVITPHRDPHIVADGSYLITGGLGGLGLTVAKSLADDGARHLVLVGRSAPNAAAQRTIAALEADGVRVVIARADVANEDDVAAVLTGIASDMPPLRGVIHAAGVLDDAVIAEMDWTRMARVLAPKVAGAWNLHLQTRRLPLDFFVCFSSVAALMGSAGQGNYAAANQFLDALAQARVAEGLPGLSINWGSWSEVGMAAALEEQYTKRWVASGMQFITPEVGVRTMHRLMSFAEAARVAVLPLNLDAISGPVPPLLRSLLQSTGRASDNSTASADILRRIANASEEDRASLLEAMLGEQVMRVLAPGTDYRPDPDRTLLALGMDSLMAIELRNRLATQLDVTVAVGDLMRGPTIRELASAVLPLLSSRANGSVRGSERVGGAAGHGDQDEALETGTI